MDGLVREKIEAYVAAHRKDMLEDLTALCRIPSVATGDDEGFPLGREVDRALHEVARLAEKRGVPCRVESERGYALGEVGSGEHAIGLFSHCDVVPAKEEEWTVTPPFEPYCDGTVFVCRGCEDNKAAAVANLYLMDMVKQGILPMKNRLLCYFGGDEERGMADIHAFLKHERVPELCLVPDSGAPFTLGEKGILWLELAANRPFRQICSFDGGVVTNAVVGSHTAEIRDPDGGLYRELTGKTAGSTRFSAQHREGITSLFCKGKSSHASEPENAVNAAVENAALLVECAGLCNEDKELLKGLLALTADPFGSGAGINSADDKFGRNTLVLGVTRCRDGILICRLDCRFGTSLPTKEVLHRLKEAAYRAGFETVAAPQQKDCFVTDVPQHLIDAFLDSYHHLTNSDAQPYYSAGGTYARYLGRALACSIFCDSGCPAVGQTFPEGHGGAHQPDEKIHLEAFYKGVTVMACLLAEMDGAVE